jgi:selenocysteine-specific elongation factor
MGFVLGTAGHVDHGKSVLVEALTGIDPDRLRDEKERGMTIDLGFAWLTLPGGREVSIVDVPGHERFIKNMLAGVGGIDLALLVIAADEGVMPQTREHLAILDLLQVSNGIAVITKKDLVDDEMLELATLEVVEVLADTTLAEAPVIAVSAVTGEGLPELVATIDRVLDKAAPKRDSGKPRLPVDRVFTMSGFGTVVTGTLVDGHLSVGQEIEVVPQSLKTHIRGLQTHKQKAEAVAPGSRVAVNLSGVSTEELGRGDVITVPGWLRPAKALDVKLNLLRSAPHGISHNTTVTFHTGAAEAQAKLRLLDADRIEPGDSAFAQLVLDHPVAAIKDDLFIVRSATETLGGGRIIDSMPKRHRRFHSATVQGLKARGQGTAEEVILATLDPRAPVEAGKLVTKCNLPMAEVEKILESLEGEHQIVTMGKKGSQLVFSATAWENQARQAEQAVGQYHQQYPLRQGMPKEELKDKLRVPAKFFDSVLKRLLEDGVLAEAGATVHLPGHQVRLTPQQQAAVDAFTEGLSRNPYAPTSDLRLDPDLLNMLVAQGRVMKIGGDVVFDAAAYDRMVAGITAHLKSHGRVTVAEVRDMFSTSRKYALALMEHLDSQKITRRVGDERVLR